VIGAFWRVQDESLPTLAILVYPKTFQTFLKAFSGLFRLSLSIYHPIKTYFID